MKKRMSILVSAVMGVIATQAEIRWSGSGLVGRDGKPWNGTVNLYRAVDLVVDSGSLATSVMAQNGQFTATTDGGGSLIAFQPMRFYYTIQDDAETFESERGVTETSWSSPLVQHMMQYPDILTISFGDMHYMRRYRTWVVYSTWAAGNGISGAWNEKDADGIYNVFRYAFNVPKGNFEGTPLIDIELKDDSVAVKTPAIVNANDVTITVVESSDVAGETVTNSQELKAAGCMAFSKSDESPRFYRLRAELSE